jgi:hypothetical protein
MEADSSIASEFSSASDIVLDRRSQILSRAAMEIDPYSRPEHAKVRSLINILRELAARDQTGRRQDDHIEDELKVVEVGTYAGITAAHLLAHVSRVTLTCIDPWAFTATSRWDEHAGLTRLDLRDIGTIARKRLMPFRKRCKIIQEPSLEAVKRFADGSCHAVFLDGDKKRLADDIAAWLPKVRRGGVLLGHACNSRVLSGQIPLAEQAAGWLGTKVQFYNGRVWSVAKP